MTEPDRRPTDDGRTEQPTDDEPDPTDPTATEWNGPTGDDAPDRFGLVASPIGGGIMLHERGTDPTPTDDDGPPWIAGSRADVIPQERWS